MLLQICCALRSRWKMWNTAVKKYSGGQIWALRVTLKCIIFFNFQNSLFQGRRGEFRGVPRKKRSTKAKLVGCGWRKEVEFIHIVFIVAVYYILQTRYIQLKTCGPQSVSLIIDQGKYLESLCLRWWTTLSRPPSLTSPPLSWSVTTSYTLSPRTSTIHNHDCHDPYSGCKIKVLPSNLFPNLPSLVWLDVRYFVAHIEKIVSLEPFADFQGQFADYVPFNLERLAKIEGGPFYASVRSI